MEIKIINAGEGELKNICRDLGLRAKMDSSDVVSKVEKILEDIRLSGDEAVCSYTEKFDKVLLTPDKIRVTRDEIDNAMKNVDPGLINIMKRAKENILEFHIAQKTPDVTVERESGAVTKLISRPLDTVGVYVPGGTAPLPSSVLMNVLPAKAAGVPRIVMCTPPAKDGSVDPVILAAANIAGADEIYRIGGAQAIAAMAYGTASVPCVDKICGPGNIFVNTAKRLLYGKVDIDMFAGPSEILIIADKTANPAFLSADLLSQAEHDKISSAILVTDDGELASQVAKQVSQRAKLMPRKDILAESLKNFCAIIVVKDLGTAVEFSNELAPEHLEICTADPEEIIKGIKNAGAIFVGNYSPEPLGDYFAGPNHVLPTSGTARFFSPLNTSDFIKKISVINYSESALAKCYEDVAEFAKAEQLECHAQSVLVRFGKDILNS